MTRAPQKRLLSVLTLFALQAALWTALSFAFAALLVLAGGFEWRAALGIAAVNWLPWVALTPAIFWLARRFPIERGRLLRSVPVHLLGAVACTAITLVIATTAFPPPVGGPPPGLRDFGRGGPGGPGGFGKKRGFGERPLPAAPAEPAAANSAGASTPKADAPAPGSAPGGPREFRGPPPDDRFGPGGPGGRGGHGGPDGDFGRGRGGRGRGGPGGLDGPGGFFSSDPRRNFLGLFGPFALRGNFGLAIYFIVVSAAHAFAYYRRAKERDLQAVELTAHLNRAKLDALRLQLQPHFLFNTLNAISTLVHRDPRAADELIGDLADLLRLSLLTTDHEVPLARELELLDRYLAIEQTRLGARLRLVREIDPAATAALVPTFVLQPLAENAIRHGLEPRAAPGTLTIIACVNAGTLTLALADDGVGLASNQENSRRGIGLANTEARLQALHGKEATLQLITPATGGLRVEITLPLRTATPREAKPTDPDTEGTTESTNALRK
ncbi:MAG: hypothetical protein RLZZ15_643 [Verrucomicrobiota bacterium]